MHSKSSTLPSAIPTLHEKRGTQAAVPMALARYVNEMQLAALQSLQSFGWHLAFVRRPLFMQSVVVVESPDKRKIAIVEADGSVNVEGFLQLRR